MLRKSTTLTTDIGPTAPRRFRTATLFRVLFAFVLVAGGFSGLAPIPGPHNIESTEAHHTSIKLPVPAGQTWVASQGYNTNPATGGSHYNCDPASLRDEPSGTRSCSQYWQYKYSFDLVPADGSSAAGHTVLSPVNGVIRWIDQAYGGMSINLEDGFAYAYFHTVLAPGLAAGQRVTQGQYLGTVAPPGQGGNGGFPHLHVTLWQTTDGGNWSRNPVAFAGSQAIEGVSLAALSDSSVNQHRGASFTSSNVALAADPLPPSPPVHLSPSHGVTYDATSHVATLTWSPSAGASEYQVWINDSPASTWITATSWTTPTLSTGQYAWQVKARGAGGEGSLSGKWVFWVDPSGNTDLPPLSTTPGALGVTTSPTSGSPGIQVIVTGAGMSANEIVRVFWDSTSGNMLGETTANSAGNWRITFTLPDATGGQHQVLARGVSSSRNAASTFTVNSALQRVPISGVPGTPIAITVKGFGANENVTLTFFHSSTSQHTLGTARTDANGTGTMTAEMPASTTGQHDYRGLGQTSGRTAWGALWVLPQITLSTDQGSPGDTVTATVRGMPGSASARVAWNQSGSSSGTTLCSSTTSATGTVVCTFTVPTAAAGAYPVVATVGTTTVSATFGIGGASAMTITPPGGVVGAQFQISLGGYQANELVRLTFDNSATMWREVRVGSNGTTLLKTTVPFLANGNHSLTARGVTSGRSSTGSITIAPSMELNQAGGAPGSSASAWMRGFAADTSITLRFNSTNASNGTSVCSGRTNSTGTFSCTFAVPSIPAATYPVRAVSNGLSATANFAVTTAGEIVGGAVIGIGTYQVTATREGLVGGTTSSGHVIVPNDHFVSLPACTPSNCRWLTPGSTHATYGYVTDCGANCFVRVTNPATGICRVEPIYDLGPWFTNDNWWEPAERRNLNNLSTSVNVLPQGYPGTDAARDGLDVGYGLSNGIGRSNVGYETGNRAAIDIADGTWQDIGFAYAAGIGTVIVSMLWQTGEDVNTARQACFGTSQEPPPTGTPRVNISSLSGHPGDLVTVTGTGFGVNELVNIFWDRTSSGSPIAQTRASASGAFSVVVTIPDDVPGSHLLVGRGVTTSGQASRSYLVLPPTRISLSPLTGASGSTTTVTGTGFHRGETVQIFWGSTGSTGTLLTSTVANDAGEINVNIAIPGAAAGGHHVVGLGGLSGLKASRTFTITEATSGPSSPRVALSTTTAFVGAQVMVSGSGYGSNEAVQVYWDSTGSTGLLLTTVTASGAGEFSTVVTIPETTPGKHLIVGRGTLSGLKPSRSLTIQAPPSITAREVAGEPGSATVIDGVRFAPQENVEVFWNSTTSTPLASTGANPDGSFSIGISIPPTAQAGPHTVIARGVTSGFEASIDFTVVAPPTTAITFEPMSGPPGTPVVVNGTGFGSGELVRIRWDNTSSGPTLGSVTASPSGAFTITVTVPDASEGPHRLIAHAQTSNKKPFRDFTVTEPQAVDPRITVDPVQGRTGSSVQVNGTNYQPGERVEIRWNSSSSTAPLLATATANSTGAFSAQITIPNVVGGSYRIVGKGLGSGKNPTRTFIVTPSTGGSAVNVEPGDVLRLTVRGFQAGERIEIYFDSVAGTPLATVTTNNLGVAATSIVIPTVVNGAHSVLAVGVATSAPAYVVTVSNGSDEPAEASFAVSSAAPGSRVTLALANFWSAERVEVFWDGRTSPTSSFIIEPTGSYSGQITIPTLPGGPHSVTVRGVTSGKSATTVITLTPATVLTPPIGAAGARIVVDVRGSIPGTQVLVYFDRPAGGAGGTLICTATARDSGTASCSFLVPSGYAVGTVVPITSTGSAGNSTALFEVRNEPVGFGPAEEAVGDPAADGSELPAADSANQGDEADASGSGDGNPAVELPDQPDDGEQAEETTPEPTQEAVQEPTAEPVPEPRNLVIVASSDVTVYGARPDDAGTEPFGLLNAGGEDGATAFITFIVEGIGAATVVDARLVLTGAGQTGGNEVVSVVPGLWIDEPGATFNGLPTSGLAPATNAGWTPVTIPPVGHGETVWIDITTSVNADGMVTVVITGHPGAVAEFLSRESGNGPRLEIIVQD